MMKNGYVSVGSNMTDNISLKRAMFAYEAANTKKDVFVRYTKAKTLKQLQSESGRARATELEKQANHDRHQAIRASLLHRSTVAG